MRNSYRFIVLPILGMHAFISAQSPVSKPEPPLHSISGVVRVAGRPVEGARVATLVRDSGGVKRVESATEANGSYRLAGLAAGDYTIYILADGRSAERRAAITPALGAELKLDIDLDSASIAGLVKNDHGEPLRGVAVRLIAREYRKGALHFVQKAVTTTMDTGQYEFLNVDPHIAWLIRATPPSPIELPISRAPLDPKARKPVLVATWYPGSPTFTAAAPIKVTNGRRTEGIDIRMLSTPNVCLEGVLEAQGVPAALAFYIDEEGTSGLGIGGPASPDGKFRACGLFPGQYRITAARIAASSDKEKPLLGSTATSLGKTDVTGIRTAAQPALTINGRTGFDVEPDKPPACTKAAITVTPLRRYHLAGESTGASSSVPGRFSLDAMFADDYMVEGTVSGAGCYIKEIRYSGINLLRGPLTGSRVDPSQDLQIVVGFNGSSLTAAVKDAEGGGAASVNVALIPEGPDSEAQLATVLQRCQTDQRGVCDFGALAPGKYVVLATGDPINLTPESLGELAKAIASYGTKVELGPRQNQMVSLSPKPLQ